MKIFRDLDEYQNVKNCIKQLNSLFDSYTIKPIINFGEDDSIWLDISYNHPDFTLEQNVKEIHHICDIIHAFLDGYKFFKSNIKSSKQDVAIVRNEKGWPVAVFDSIVKASQFCMATNNKTHYFSEFSVH